MESEQPTPRLNKSQIAYSKLRRSTPAHSEAKFGLNLCDTAVVLGPEAHAQLSRDLESISISLGRVGIKREYPTKIN